MKKRLYEKRSKVHDIFIILINSLLTYLFLSWDYVFGDVFALAPGYLLTMIYALPKSGYVVIIVSAVYAIIWSLYHSAFLWLSPLFFILFSLLGLLYTHKRRSVKAFFSFFYIPQFLFCVWFYNQSQILSTQLIQLSLYLIVFLHIKTLTNKK